METDGEQNQQGASANGSPSSGTSSRPSAMNSMSLYERQAVQVGGVSVCLCSVLDSPVAASRTRASCPHRENVTCDTTAVAACVSVFVLGDLFERKPQERGIDLRRVDGGFVIFTPLGHKTEPSVFFTPSL